MAKIEIVSLLDRILLYYPTGQNSLKIALSLTVFEIFTLFRFPLIEIFPLCIGYSCTTLWVKIRSKTIYLLRFSRYSHIFIFHKNPRWLPKVAKIEIFPLCIGYSCTALWVKIRSKSLYLLRFSRYSHFFIFRKNPRWLPKVAKIEIFPLCIDYSRTTLWVKNLLEISLYLLRFARYL